MWFSGQFYFSGKRVYQDLCAEKRRTSVGNLLIALGSELHWEMDSFVISVFCVNSHDYVSYVPTAVNA
jgi:hypothetical protein